MKKISIILILLFTSVIILGGCANNSKENGKLLRIHIRADSDSYVDQNVKMSVKDEVVAYLDGKLKYETDFLQAIRTVNDSVQTIKAIADDVLAKGGFDYRATVKVAREYFPTRCYEDIVVESGIYDALIIELGSGSGDNWWCVIYPPLCFVGREGEGEITYKSKIAEIWRKYFS